MALVTITGLPCSGKTTLASQLLADLERRLSSPSYTGRKLSVVLINEQTLSIPRSSYAETRSEKPARASLMSAVVRHLNKNTIVICDALNYIKGFRYQLYCAAREVGSMNATIWPVVLPEQCEKWNAARSGEAYSTETLRELAMRYEEPNASTRWDSPLFSVADGEPLPLDQIWETLTTGQQKPANIGVKTTPAAAPNFLQLLDAITQQVASSILSASSSSPSGGTVKLQGVDVLPPGALEVELPPRAIAPSQMNRFRRQFIALHRNEPAVDAEKIARLFAAFVENALRES